jgi:uncharacterized protein (DUF2252 family)
MGQNPFRFLRATYFRWARKIEKLLPDLNDAPKVLSVGDAHLENFGTWRDAEGRLVWGINDFDDAAVMPYPLDLVRLCTSASLSPDLKTDGDDAAAAILDGYVRGLKKQRPPSWMEMHLGCGRLSFHRSLSVKGLRTNSSQTPRLGYPPG